MPTETIDDARRLIQARLTELDAEATSLRKALETLGSGADSRPEKPSPKATRKSPRAKRTTKRAPRGRRRSQLLTAVERQPGATAAQLAEKIGISTNQAYALAARLHRDGELTRRGRAYHPATSSQPKSRANRAVTRKRSSAQQPSTRRPSSKAPSRKARR